MATNGATVLRLKEKEVVSDFELELLKVNTELKKGNFAVRMPLGYDGVRGKISDTFNEVVETLANFEEEFRDISTTVGKEGKLKKRLSATAIKGSWGSYTDSINNLIDDLVFPAAEIDQVITSVAKGNLSRKMPLEIEGRELRGSFLQTAKTINTMVDQLNSFSEQVTEVALSVGTEGILGGQADVKGVSGIWKELTKSVNTMANNLTNQVRNIAEVATAVATGNLSKKITVDAKGETLELKNTINKMVDQLNSFSEQVTRVALSVGTEGILGGQADVKGVSGIWKELTQSVNTMANNLTSQVRNIAEVATAVAQGNLSRKITVDARGEILELKSTLNKMVDQLSTFASEVTIVAKNVGTDGILGGQARVEGVSGTWKELTESVNTMANNLTNQVRNIAQVTTAVAGGDLSQKITIDARGEILDLKNTINTMVDQLSIFSSEVTRVAKEVGTEGILGGQADVEGVTGTWKALTDNVNTMADNLTYQVRNIAEVATAVAKGDLTKTITVDAKGEIHELKSTINIMVDQLSTFASEVTRVAKDVGTEGILGGQARVEGVSGTWKELTESVNTMANNLTSQVRNIAEITTALANGDLTKKITVDVKGEILDLKNTINSTVDQLSTFGSEVTRVALEVGTEGILGGQAQVRGVSGIWKELTDNVNTMASNLTNQVRNIAQVATAVAQGDLSKKITVTVKGEVSDLKTTINTMVDQLSSFSQEVTRVALAVGTEGMLGGQAKVSGVAGIWKDLTDNVNTMANNLTLQVRGISKVVQAIARGDLTQKISLHAKGEIADLADTINDMTTTLSTFADEVTRVAREVGFEGKLGGQAEVKRVSGTWKDLTDNVNQLANNLTTQVRAIAEVATAVTGGDLTRTVTVEARGEVESLKNYINEMIRNLQQTTQVNKEQDWLKTNLAVFARLLQGQRDIQTVAQMLLSRLAPVAIAQYGGFYIYDSTEDGPVLKLLASYGFSERQTLNKEFRLGEGLVGQCAQEGQRILLREVPQDYIKISSGMGEASPQNIVVIPVLFENGIKSVIELASFNSFSEVHLTFLEQLAESLGIVLNTIAATMRTEQLLTQSQALSEELQQTNEELKEKANLLSQQNKEVEEKNKAVEGARLELQEKAEQLALTSKYKSEFLANMSHELRTPLNSLLILSQKLADNVDGNLSLKQTDYAKNIHASGEDLLNLINDILDLSKIEAGKMTVEISDIYFGEVQTFAERNFGQLAKKLNLDFNIRLDEQLPDVIRTDEKRLQQVLKNLLSNAFKFTEKGHVTLNIYSLHDAGHAFPGMHAAKAGDVIAFAVSDTGIGIPSDKKQIIFEAFQQVDGTTTRKYGGTGLGLSISREIAALLGGEIHLESEEGGGSTFTLFLPQAVLQTSVVSEPEPQPEVVERKMIMRDVPNEVTYVEKRIKDDRDQLQSGDRMALLVVDDVRLGQMFMELAHNTSFKVVVAMTGAEALNLAAKFKPEAIVLDLELTDSWGWVVLDRLKKNADTRHLPLAVVCQEDKISRALKYGVLACLKRSSGRGEFAQVINKLSRFIDRKQRTVLVVSREDDRAAMLRDTVSADSVAVKTTGLAVFEYEKTRAADYDLIIIDRQVGDAAAEDTIQSMVRHVAQQGIPLVIYSEGDLPASLVGQMAKSGAVAAIMRVTNTDKLLEAASLFLHIGESELPPEKSGLLKKMRDQESVLDSKKVLIVDDDIRNIFAISSILEELRMKIFYAEDGKQAIQKLKENSDVDLVLMDIMMPEMDGFETTRQIRLEKEFANLPIIAVTAKAMKGDREKCIEAGASDYLTKPIDTERLISMLRVWLAE